MAEECRRRITCRNTHTKYYDRTNDRKFLWVAKTHVIQPLTQPRLGRFESQYRVAIAWINNSVGDLPTQIPGIHVSRGSVLKSSARRKQQVIVFVEVIIAANREARLIRLSDVISGLMKYLATKRQFIGELLLQQPSEVPVILVTKSVALIYPVTAAPICRPITKIFLNPYGKEDAGMARSKTAVWVACR